MRCTVRLLTPKLLASSATLFSVSFHSVTICVSLSPVKALLPPGCVS
jgi:hypothetical protein